MTVAWGRPLYCLQLGLVLGLGSPLIAKLQYFQYINTIWEHVDGNSLDQQTSKG